jgi:biopolymer transport protein ExbB/TolQ
MTDFFDFIRNNFWHVSPILASAVVAIAIVIERSKALFSAYPIKDMEGFFERVGLAVSSGKVADAIAVCDKFPLKPVAQVTKQGLLRAHQPEELIESGLAIEVGKAAQSIQSRTAFLSTIANVATLFGLFGTIAGLIQSFQAVGHADAQQKSALLAAGISQAMNATMLGLAVAIPSMIAFALLASRTNRLVAEVDGSAVRVMDLLRQRCYSAEAETLKTVSNGHEAKARAS